jgi:hypothetical protein
MFLLWLLIRFILLLSFLSSLFLLLLVFLWFVISGKLSSEDRWQSVNIIIAFLVLMATGFAAYAAYKSYRITQSIAQTNLYYHRQAIYSSDDMLIAFGLMEELSLKRDEDKDAFIKILKRYRNRDLVPVRWQVKDEKGRVIGGSTTTYQYRDVKKARRQVSHFFLTTFEMFASGDLDKASYQKICAYKSFYFLYNVIEWLELADAYGWKYDRDTFTMLLHQSGRSPREIEELEKLRPPETWAEVEQMIQSSQQQSE